MEGRSSVLEHVCKQVLATEVERRRLRGGRRVRARRGEARRRRRRWPSMPAAPSSSPPPEARPTPSTPRTSAAANTMAVTDTGSRIDGRERLLHGDRSHEGQLPVPARPGPRGRPRRSRRLGAGLPPSGCSTASASPAAGATTRSRTRPESGAEVSGGTGDDTILVHPSRRRHRCAAAPPRPGRAAGRRRASPRASARSASASRVLVPQPVSARASRTSSDDR